MTSPHIPTGPLDCEPSPLFLPEPERRLLLEVALQGVELGAWDERIVAWLARMTDTSTLVTVAGLIERARAAELAASTSPRVAPRIISLPDRTL